MNVDMTRNGCIKIFYISWLKKTIAPDMTEQSY